MSDVIILLSTQFNFNWNIVELTAVFFSIIYVILATKENILCWVAAMISVSLYIYICYNANLFAETGLQIFYLIMAVYGYYNWNNNKKTKIIEWNTKKHLIIIFIGLTISFLLGFYLSIYSASRMPIIDSFTTVFSIIATYMVTQKILENWLYWIVIDAVSIYLYFNRDLHLSSLLFIVYTILACIGYFAWLKNKNTKCSKLL